MSRAPTDRLDELARAVGEVQTAVLVEAISEPSAFTYELKWDGYRVLAVKAGDAVRLVSRKRQDFTKEFGAVARDVATVPAREFVLDGEVCALDSRGVPKFQMLQRRMRERAPLAYFVFDLLWLDGEDLRAMPIEERRELLARVVVDLDRKGSVVRSTAAEGDPSSILALACSRGLEGIVAKRKGSAYAAGKRPTWLKLKCKLRQELAVVGYLPLLETRDAVGSLLVAVAEGDFFRYAGKVGTGFDDQTRVELAKELSRDRADAPTAVGVPRAGGLARYVRPRLVAEVEMTEWTEGGHVRHASFQGLRRDKKPEECVREAPADAKPPPPPGNRVEVAGISISHPSRVLEPTNLTKLELARYYEAVAPWMLPHVAGRPLTLVRWAEGKATEKGGGVYLRHAKAWGPAALRRVRIREKTKTGEYLVADDEVGLVALAQMDILEVHTWSSKVEDVERPDRMVFDLDPAPDVKWPEVRHAAHDLRGRLASLGLASFVKTTGGKGLHVVVPIVPGATWEDCLAFSRALARLLAREEPTRFVAAVPKAARRGKILLDYLRNNRGNTSVAAFSTRARPFAPVSVPLAWEELDEERKPDRWNVRDILERVRRQRRDPWEGFFTPATALPVQRPR